MAKHYLIAAIAQGIGLVSAGVVTVVVSRVLGPAGRGEYAVLAGVVQLLAMLGQMGFPAGAIHMGTRGLVPLPRLRRLAQLIPIVSTTLGCALLAAAFAFWPAVVGDAPVEAWIVAGLILPFLLAGQLGGALFFALQRPSLYNGLYILQQGAWVACAAAAALQYRTVTAALAGWLLSLVVWNAAMTWRLSALVATAPWTSLRTDEVKRVLGFGVQSTAGLLLQLATSRVTLFIVSATMGSAEAGLFSIATVLAETLWQAVAAASQVSLPRASADYGRGESPSGVMLASRLAVALTVCAGGAVAALAPVLVPVIFGPAFAPAAVPLRILISGTVVFSLSLILTADLLARGYPHLSAVSSGITFTITGLLSLALVPRWGATGAASAACVGYVVATASMIFVHHRLTGMTMRFLLATPSDVRSAFDALRR